MVSGGFVGNVENVGFAECQGRMSATQKFQLREVRERLARCNANVCTFRRLTPGAEVGATRQRLWACEETDQEVVTVRGYLDR